MHTQVLIAVRQSYGEKNYSSIVLYSGKIRETQEVRHMLPRSPLGYGALYSKDLKSTVQFAVLRDTCPIRLITNAKRYSQN